MEAWNIIWDARDMIVAGLLNTLSLFVLSILIAFVLGCILVYRMEEKGVVERILRALINAMRTVPFLILAYLLYYGLPQLGLKMNAWTAGLVALALYHGAYFAEIMRGHRQVLPVGLVEAARAYGFTPVRLYVRIVLPQLVMKSRSLMGNQMILALKDTALLSIITVQELTAAANSISSTYFISTEVFVMVILVYWGICICIESVLRWVRRFGTRRGFENV